jgi:hypothetical protein
MAARLPNHPISQSIQRFYEPGAVDVARQLHAANTSSFT